MFYPKNCWKPTSNLQCHWKDGKHHKTHLYSNIKITLSKPTSSPEVFIKCRKESSVGYPLPQNHLSPYPNTSKGICWAVHHIPGYSVLHPADPNTRFSWKPRLSKPAQNTLSFAPFLTTFYCISKFAPPSVHQPGFPLDSSVTQSLVFMPGSPTALLRLGWFILITQIRNKAWKTEISA